MPLSHDPPDANAMPELQGLPDLLSAYHGIVALFDAHDRLHWANPRFRQTFGIDPEQYPTWSALMRSSYHQKIGVRINCQDFEHWLASAASRRGKVPYRQFEADTHDGRWFVITQTTDARGWMLEIGVDVSDMGCEHRDLRAARDRALRASQEDPLTGVPNRAAVLTRLDAALAEVAQTSVCVALVDLDHFKQVNDRHGHAAGDQVLCDFAKRLQDSLRRTDTGGRIGGEEFLLVLTGTDLEAAHAVVHRLMAQARQARPLASAPAFGYTFSAGLVQAQPGETREALLARADQLLYAAKRAGRDRCLTHTDTETRCHHGVSLGAPEACQACSSCGVRG